MTMVSMAMLASDAKKADVINAVAIMTPNNTVALTRGCCAIDPNATYQTPATYWYDNYASVDNSIVQVWQDAANGTLPQGLDLTGQAMTGPQILAAMLGLKIYTALNCTDAVAWAETNLGSEGLQFVPSPPL